jgi:hypothetical protein
MGKKTKAAKKDTSKKVIMSRVLSWGRDWLHDFASRVRQWGDHFFGCLGVATLAAFIFGIFILYVVVPHHPIPESPEELLSEFQMLVIVIFLYVFLPYLALVFLLSLHPRTRPTADKLALRFLGQTEVDKLKIKVEGMSSELREIKSSLANIETTLKSLVDKERDSKQ